MAIPGEMKIVFVAGIGLIGLFFSTMGLLTLVTAVKKYRINRQRDRFEPVEARVLNSEIESSHTSDGTSYSEAIEYEYEVDNETFVSDSVNPGADANRTTQTGARKYVEEYPEGATVEAFYDPEDPSVAFLENKSVLGQSIVYSVIAVGVLTVGVGLLGGAMLLMF
jgi:hypothetical protein